MGLGERKGRKKEGYVGLKTKIARVRWMRGSNIMSAYTCQEGRARAAQEPRAAREGKEGGRGRGKDRDKWGKGY
eukprot:3746767-Rhodomonas_salina.1